MKCPAQPTLFTCMVPHGEITWGNISIIRTTWATCTALIGFARECRHYVDRLVRYSTGRERAAAAAAKFVYETRRQNFRWTSGLTACTDVQYYGHLKAMGQASLAMAAMLTNRGKMSRLLTSRVRPLPSTLLFMAEPFQHTCNRPIQHLLNS